MHIERFDKRERDKRERQFGMRRKGEARDGGLNTTINGKQEKSTATLMLKADSVCVCIYHLLT